MNNYIWDWFLTNINDIIKTEHKKHKIIVKILDWYSCEMEVTSFKKVKIEWEWDLTVWYWKSVIIESKKDMVVHLFADSIQINSLCKVYKP